MILSHVVWLFCDSDIKHHTNPNPRSQNEKINWNENENNKRKEFKSTIFNFNITSLQGFSFEKIEFHFCQFLSNFFKYSFLNFPSFHLYNTFAIYFLSNFPLLKSLSSTMSSFFCCLIFILNLPSNSAITFFVFSKFFSFFQKSYSTVNLFYCTKYFTTSLTFILFSIFSTFHSFIWLP